MRRLIERMERIEMNFDHIWVKQGFKSVPLSEVSSYEAMTWIFKWLREALQDGSENAASRTSGNSE